MINMINTIIVMKSTRPTKKYMAIVDNKKVHFGQKNASDFTLNRDELRKQLYINRHKKREEKFWGHNKENLLRPSYWSRWLLWNKKTLTASKKFIERKHNITIN